jgi:hypothetical protein
VVSSASGRVDALFRYPVKSMAGETLASATIGDRGVLGDRAYALVDGETGKVVSAKNPRRWSTLLDFGAAYLAEPQAGADPPPVRITLPDGTTVASDDAEVHATLSRALGRQVRLETAPPEHAALENFTPALEGLVDPAADTVHDSQIALVAPGTFFDAAPLHVVTTASLRRLGELAPGSDFSPRRFRPNVVVAVPGASGFVENDWIGHELTIGGMIASAFLAAPRCVMTTVGQPGLPRDLGVLQTVATHNRLDIPGLGPSSCVGIYAIVAQGGTVTRGDAVELR